MGEHGHEFKARRFTVGTVKAIKIASDISCMIFQMLTVRSHADAKLSMHFLGSAAIVVLSICRHVCHFCIYRW
jgi:hypothetical protein